MAAPTTTNLPIGAALLAPLQSYVQKLEADLAETRDERDRAQRRNAELESKIVEMAGASLSAPHRVPPPAAPDPDPVAQEVFEAEAEVLAEKVWLAGLGEYEFTPRGAFQEAQEFLAERAARRSRRGS